MDKERQIRLFDRQAALECRLDAEFMLADIDRCHHTRDIPGLLAEAGIRIVSKESPMLKMVQLLRARPGT